MSSRLVCGARSSMDFPPGSAEAETALAEGIERPPEHPVEQRHQNTHNGDAEHDAREVAGFGRGCYISAQAGCRQMAVAPARHFGDDRGVHDPPDAVMAPVM